MISARFSSDYCYFNHNNKCVCFKFDFKKRVKTKVLNYLKNEHNEGKINNYLKGLNLMLNKTLISNNYIHYEIKDRTENTNDSK